MYVDIVISNSLTIFDITITRKHYKECFDITKKHFFLSSFGVDNNYPLKASIFPQACIFLSTLLMVT